MPCIKNGIKDHVFMQSIQDADMQYPERPLFMYKQTAEEKMEDDCLRMMRVMFGGPSRLDNQDRRKTNQEHDFTCVKASWNQFCKVPGKALNIEDALLNMNKASHLRILSSGKVSCDEDVQRAQALGWTQPIFLLHMPQSCRYCKQAENRHQRTRLATECGNVSENETKELSLSSV